MPPAPAWQKLCPVSSRSVFRMGRTGESLSVKRLICGVSGVELKISIAGITQYKADLIVIDFYYIRKRHG